MMICLTLKLMERQEGTVGDADEGGGDMEQQVGLVMPRRKTKVPSAVWKCADPVEGGARCMICRHIIKFVSGSTSAILNHLLSLHGNRVEVQKLRVDMKRKKEMLLVRKGGIIKALFVN